ncbi:MAG: DUF1045 domain-containing protein [Rubrivivax sp.]|nr:DUF1045 domain-containing protein [Rubrivivax sp.]
MRRSIQSRRDTLLTSPRHAVYWTPEPGHPLWAAGCAWLGRDPSAPALHEGGPPPGRAAPWRYGLHATLKPPMHLAPGRELAGLCTELQRLAEATPRFALQPLGVATLGRFVALRPPCTPPRLQALADACVTRLDPWRAPLAPGELERRAAGLSEERRALLQRWGYPHVLQAWRFHLTLSDSIADAAARQSWLAAARQHFADALAAPLEMASISLFEEPAPGEPFRLRQRFALRQVS